MTALALVFPVRPRPRAHAPVARAGDLEIVLQPGINLALWCREPVSAVVDEVAKLPACAFPDLRCVTSARTCRADLEGLFRQRDLDSGRFPRWIQDMAQLTAAFFPLAGERPVTLRIETLGDDGCRRFHVDRNHLRLLCTYRGPGTEWLDNGQVDRAALEQGAPNEGIVRHGTPERFRPFWVGVMKGDAFPGNRGNGPVHRSPPIADTGHTRVLFCLDA